MMAFLTLEDQDGSCDAVVFARVYEQCRDLLRPEAILFLKGSVDAARERPSLIVAEAIPVEDADRAFAAEVRIAIPRARLEDALLGRLAEVLRARRGDCPVTLEVEARSGVRARVRVGRDLFVAPGQELLAAIDAVLGDGAARILGALGRDEEPGLEEGVPALEEALAG
jgi:DNA polymerase-3 subunit alpha